MGEPVTMNTLAVAISVIGVISSIFTCFMNIYILKKITEKKKDMILFYYRFALDVALGALVALFLAFVIFISFFPDKLGTYHNLIFYLSFPATNVSSVRSIVTLTVAIERLVAVFFPMFFHKNHQKCPTLLILILAITFGLADDAVLYGLCQFHLEIPKNCMALGCAVNTCFLTYWSGHKSIIFASTFLFAFLLWIKLLFSKKSGNVEWSRINRLTLFDAIIIFLFSFLPNIIANQFAQFFSYQNIGPYSSVAKLFGCAVEAYLVFKVLIRPREAVSSESSDSTLKKKNTSKARKKKKKS